MSITRWIRKVANRIAVAAYVFALKLHQLPRVLGESTPRITSDEIIRAASGDIYAIAVRFPLLGTDDGFLALLDALKRHGVNTIVVCNSPLEPSHLVEIRERAYRLILRPNVGRDFGAYRAVTLQLHRDGIVPGRLLYFNDSLIYLPGAELDRMVGELCNRTAGLVGAFENHERYHHVGSYAFSLSAAAFGDPAIRRFWQNYRPYDVRPHAILKGEIALTRRLKRRGYSLDVIYSAERIAALLDTMSMTELVAAQRWLPSLTGTGLLHSPAETRRLLSRTVGNEPRVGQGTPRIADFRAARKASSDTDIVREQMIRDSLVDRMMGSFMHGSQVHLGFGLFHRLMHSPLVKKDLLSRGIYLEQEALRVLGDLPEADALRLVRQLSSRGRAIGLSPWQAFLINNGLV